MDKKMMSDVLGAYGPSGREETVARVIADYIKPYCDEVYSDVLGNLIGVKKGTSGKKIMLTAHMDQIGFVVMGYEEDGFLRVSNIGGILPPLSMAREVVFENGTKGVTYFETEVTRDKRAVASIANMYIDIGAKTAAEAEALAGIGEVGVFVSQVVELANGRIASGAQDNRICCFAIMEVLKTMRTPHDVYAVFTVQEEVGLRGAGSAAFAIEPDLNINLDVTTTGDTPKAPKMSVALGQGPAVKMMDSSVIIPMQVRKFMEETAKSANIAFQREVLRGGGTDTAVVQRTKSGILAGCISIPCRYVHTPTETVDLSDVQGAINLLNALVAQENLPNMEQ